MFIIKLGGSLITYKDDISCSPFKWNETDLRYRIREDRILSAGKVISRYLDEGILLVHGGGTHGHRTVRRWKEGWAKGSEEMRVWEVKWRMLQLTERLIALLGKCRIPVVEVSPSDIAVMDGRNIDTIDDTVIRELVDKGFVPVLRGDLAMDKNGGWSIISGDEIIRRLSISLMDIGIEKVIMCMDAEGVYREYGTDDQSVIEIMDDDIGGIGGKGPQDETGGINKKISVCSEISRNGIPTQIIGGRIEQNLEKALEGKKTGTMFPVRKLR